MLLLNWKSFTCHSLCRSWTDNLRSWPKKLIPLFLCYAKKQLVRNCKHCKLFWGCNTPDIACFRVLCELTQYLPPCLPSLPTIHHSFVFSRLHSFAISSLTSSWAATRLSSDQSISCIDGSWWVQPLRSLSTGLALSPLTRLFVVLS